MQMPLQLFGVPASSGLARQGSSYSPTSMQVFTRRHSPPIRRLACDVTNSRRSGEFPRDDDGDHDQLRSAASMPVLGPDADWREFRARLVAGEAVRSPDRPAQWAHTLPAPEQGCLLIAHPLMFMESQQYFHKAVLLLFEHSERGSAGLILNRPTAHTIAGLGTSMQRLCPEFQENILYLGGDVGRDTVHMLHGQEGLQDAVKIVNGVYMGGFNAALGAVQSGRAAPRDFKWFSRYAGWSPGQLQRECDAGVWFPAAASASVVLNNGPTSMSGVWMWHQVLELMGGEYAKLSDAVKENYRPDVMGNVE